jgi:hypothetical protein
MVHKIFVGILGVALVAGVIGTAAGQETGTPVQPFRFNSIAKSGFHPVPVRWLWSTL